MAIKRGAFILFEGCDRVGKSTQVERLVEYLKSKGLQAKSLRFPNRTTVIGKAINAYLTQASELDDRSIHLLFSANRWEMMKEMESLLLSGCTLVVDRYAYSGVAYTHAKGYPLRWCQQPDQGLLRPDMTLYLTLPMEKCREREAFGGERYENETFQYKVAEAFEKLKECDWKEVDASESIEAVSKKVITLVEQQMNKLGDLQRLWMEEE